MEEKIREYLEQYLETHPGYKVNEKLFADRNNGNDRLLAGSKSVFASFQKMAEAHNYQVKLDVVEDCDLRLQLASEKGNIYSTYVFKHAIIPE